jgi:6-pyruvoyltetrahydropterin/6-carboxytetrahydropterin synthase
LIEEFSMFQITRDFEVPASHRLFGHEGYCRFIHGHNWLLSVVFSSEKLDNVGRIVDFSKVKKVVGEWLEENWDHCMLVNENDTDVLGLAVGEIFAKVMNVSLPNLFKKLYVFKGNPTAELMAKELFTVVRGLMAKNNLDVKVEKVRCRETSNCCAEYTPEGDLSESSSHDFESV